MTDSANLNSAILQAEINSAYPALKIVSLLPSATEIIDCLGLINAVVGRSHECDYPPTVKDFPSVPKPDSIATKIVVRLMLMSKL